MWENPGGPSSQRAHLVRIFLSHRDGFQRCCTTGAPCRQSVLAVRQMLDWDKITCWGCSGGGGGSQQICRRLPSPHPLSLLPSMSISLTTSSTMSLSVIILATSHRVNISHFISIEPNNVWPSFHRVTSDLCWIALCLCCCQMRPTPAPSPQHCLLMAAVNYITAFKILFWRRWRRRHCVW